MGIDHGDVITPIVAWKCPRPQESKVDVQFSNPSARQERSREGQAEALGESGVHKPEDYSCSRAPWSLGTDASRATQGSNHSMKEGPPM